MNRHVLFIHGAWLTPDAWQPFMGRFRACGFVCSAPPWIYMECPVTELRQHPARSLATLDVKRIVDHYAQLVTAYEDPPILVGHSFGGLFVQLLLDRGLGALGIAIDAVPPRGVPPGLTALMAALPLLTTWNGWNRVLTMTQPQFMRNFAQSLPPQEANDAYGRYIVPAPGRIFFQAALGLGTRVNYANDRRAPLLLMAGEADRTIQASMVKATYKRYRRSVADTSYVSFPNRTHWLIAEEGWEEVADCAIEWIEKQRAGL
ncbi:alpha/beta fold hydrolase [Marinobacter nanhaiticus D15-8W]|uniref:Alpha/beta hydrolase n=1 Tax=Marinobacter nanhaiticus D15-8W TaxID=626887 RepID=N6WYS6_9GAMM|nr:alpha/beta hydrolase [Marinobacter nanhaiticus]ENO13948.1 alpha/beta hydrolase [Marinobacter nanhaiticus D15-8W]BES71326.1 alpha/beta fold hydrolase [Marinobacter nanhaiticus D15-8W]